MGKPGRKQSEKPELRESFEENIATLFDEISFAIQWKRPSILLVSYDSENLRDQAVSALEKRVKSIGQSVIAYPVNEKNFDIARLLSQRPERKNSVYFVTGLSNAGGQAGANAYRALNIRREYFVDYAIRVIFWLTKTEATELPLHAPDFWAFRHREVEFSSTFSMERLGILNGEPGKLAPEISSEQSDLDGQISLLEAQLSGLGKESDTLQVRLETLGNLAWLQRAHGTLARSEIRTKQALALARELNDGGWLGKLWGNLGDLYLEQEQKNRAIRAYRKAIRYSPTDAALWYRLGHFYHIMKRFPNAIIAYKQAIRLDKNNILAHSSLVACFRLTGKKDLAKTQMKTARPILQNEAEYNQAIFESACGNTLRALVLLEQAIQKSQVHPDQLRREPNFDFIRDEPRFIKAVGLINSRDRN